MFLYHDRQDAGRVLAGRIAENSPHDPLLVALPRGGVPLAAEMHRLYGWEMDMLLVRKMAVPSSPEFARGALAEQGEPYWNQDLLDRWPLSKTEQEDMLLKAKREIREQAKIWHHTFPSVSGRIVIVVDDGLATGWTALAAARALSEAKEVWGAFPVAPLETKQMLESTFDKVICPHWIENFQAVSLFYRHFQPVANETVLQALS